MELLPEGCIANAISFTTPRDACRLSSVSTIFKSAAESDAVWESFLPPDYSTLLSSSSSSSSLRSSSKKELYFSLCHNPILIDEGKKFGSSVLGVLQFAVCSFSLQSGVLWFTLAQIEEERKCSRAAQVELNGKAM